MHNERLFKEYLRDEEVTTTQTNGKKKVNFAYIKYDKFSKGKYQENRQ